MRRLNRILEPIKWEAVSDGEGYIRYDYTMPFTEWATSGRGVLPKSVYSEPFDFFFRLKKDNRHGYIRGYTRATISRHARPG